ncbi:hypothetical protein MASR2M15_06400 [Anaerolineales bacterium]
MLVLSACGGDATPTTQPASPTEEPQDAPDETGTEEAAPNTDTNTTSDTGVSITVNSDYNILERANMNSDFVVKIPAGTVLPVLAKSSNGNFYLVDFDGTKGWMNRWGGGAFKINGDINALEVSEFDARTDG